MKLHRPTRGDIIGIGLGIVAATVVVLLVTSLTTMLLARRAGQADPVACGVTSCIPLAAQQITATVQDSGFDCALQRATTWSCTLTIGIAHFRLWIGQQPQGVDQVTAQVDTDPPAAPGETAVAFLQWVACLPVAGEPGHIDQVTVWLREQLAAGRTVESSVGGYTYRLEHSKPGSVTLRILTHRSTP